LLWLGSKKHGSDDEINWGNAEARVPRLSAIIIAKNEAANIAECLDSVAFCDERIVVDGDGVDGTAEIARQHGARVATHDWRGFGAQKNFALSLAQGDWVLSIDADERVSPALESEIQKAIASGAFAAYKLPRLSSFCGREMHHSGWYPDYVLRLFRRGRARFSDDLVHERVVCDDPVGRLEQPLRHFPIKRLEDVMSRMDRYSTAGAEMLVAAGRRVSFTSGLGHGLWTFLRSYFLRLGMLDGREGFLLAVANAEGTYYRYMKAWLACRAAAAKISTELVSVVVTTYERADALDAVLRGLSHQTDRNFEIIIADDGSGPDTARAVEAWSSRLAVPIKRVWHEHCGFRGGEIRNRGIRASTGALCIFLDGDCIPRVDFVARHRRLAEPGWFVTGNRILLSQQLTETVLPNGQGVENWGLGTLLVERMRGRVNRLLPALRLALGPLRRLQSNAWQGAQTCNLAVARVDLDRVDGFDAAYTGWGLEDSDLVVRLLHAGVCRKDGRFATDVLHLWHPKSDRSQLGANQAKLDEVVRGTRVRATRGMSLLSDEIGVPTGSDCTRLTG
jgi:glycosyltransferase involved in cell wall biosynthesis